MNVSVSVKIDGLLRGLRLAGHALAETAERQVLRASARGPLAQRPPVAAEEREGERS